MLSSLNYLISSKFVHYNFKEVKKKFHFIKTSKENTLKKIYRKYDKLLISLLTLSYLASNLNRLNICLFLAYKIINKVK